MPLRDCGCVKKSFSEEILNGKLYFFCAVHGNGKHLANTQFPS